MPLGPWSLDRLPDALQAVTVTGRPKRDRRKNKSAKAARRRNR